MKDITKINIKKNPPSLKLRWAKGGERMNFYAKPVYARVLMAGSVLAVILAGIGAAGTDLWLASTQWLLIAIFLAVAGVFVLLETGE